MDDGHSRQPATPAAEQPLRHPDPHRLLRPAPPPPPNAKISTTHPLPRLHARGKEPKPHLRPSSAGSRAIHQTKPALATQGCLKDRPIHPGHPRRPPHQPPRGPAPRDTPPSEISSPAPPAEPQRQIRPNPTRRPSARHLPGWELRSRCTARGRRTPARCHHLAEPPHRRPATAPLDPAAASAATRGRRPAPAPHGQRRKKGPAAAAPTGLCPSAPAGGGGGGREGGGVDEPAARVSLPARAGAPREGRRGGEGSEKASVCPALLHFPDFHQLIQLHCHTY